MKLFKIIPQKRFLIIVAVMFILCFSFVSYFVVKTSAQNNLVAQTNKLIISSSALKILPVLPVRIIIPKLKINATIESLGLTADGAVDSPVGPKNAGWYNLGPIPGEKGNSIIDGHSGWKNNIPAVFDNLNKLKKGDKIYIENNNGVITTFIVNKLKIYGKNDTALDVFISNNKKASLNLISCSGVWDNISKGRSSRIVVFSDMELKNQNIKK